MTIVLELPASIEAALAQRATQQGMTPETVVLADLRRLYPQTVGGHDPLTLSAYPTFVP
jgi:hypothetical protein